MDENNNNVPDSGISDSNRRIVIISLSAIVVIGVFALIFFLSILRKTEEASLISRYSPSLPITSTPDLNNPPVPNYTATQLTWIKPPNPPSLASASEAKTAYDSGTSNIEDYSLVFPDVPDVIQPGDIYSFEIQLAESKPLIWSYGWCTTTQEILEENFKHIQLEFTMNETVVPLKKFAIVDFQRDDGSPCRSYIALVNEWPLGQHHLEAYVTFTKDINDGWNAYPAGTHIFKHVVTINRSAPTAEAIQSSVNDTVGAWKVLLSDTFDNNANQWLEGTSDEVGAKITYKVTGGKYRWEAESNQGFVVARSLFDEPVGDFYFTMEVQYTGEAMAEYGIVFRDDGNGNFYYFTMTAPVDSCSILQYYNGEWTPLTNWDNCPLFSPTESNRMSLLVQGDYFVAFVNDKLVGDAHSNLIKGNNAGIGVSFDYPGTTAVFDFDNLEVKVP